MSDDCLQLGCENAPKGQRIPPITEVGLHTSTPSFAADLMEVVRLFDGAETLAISHSTVFSDGYFASLVTLGNVTYDYLDKAPEITNELEKKRYYKRAAKLALYRALSSYFDVKMPWGSLTGIRPVRLARQSIEKTGEFEKFFVEEMGVSKYKTQLVADIIRAQNGVYDEGKRNVDLFVGIPFCPTRCSYCSFVSAPISKCTQWIDAYTDALKKEIRAAKTQCGNLRSVYVGGGTPVCLPEKNLVKILEEIGDVGVEYTVEAGRPDAITLENLKLLKSFGVTRICVNPQTFSDQTLERIGRKHTADDVLKAYEIARKVGFDINMDFIAGLPGEDYATFKKSIDLAVSIDPENITVHTLCLKKGSELKENTARLQEGETGKMVDYARIRTAESGYNPYYLYRQKYAAGSLENTGYAKKGKVCVYNVDVMEETASNLACGANGISKRVYLDENRIERVGAPKDIPTYLQKVDRLIEEKSKLFGDLCPQTVYKER